MTVNRPSVGSYVTGGITILVGLLAFAESLRYPLGAMGQIGPAIFPIGLSLLLAAAGIGIIIEDVRNRIVPEGAVPPRNILAVVAGPMALALLIDSFGMVPAIFAGVLISALADRELRLWTALAVATVLAVGCTLVFITLLKLPIAPIGWPF
ncbi:tripartite tricarboxylate transporter TctB family protein [Pelagibacterium halotolerans]|uniref:Tricarboxylate transport protein TctB n=1 Tax=Pelagibacterium halotolerans (strain DSM 22347 / JCM 15775 / CGMCC 1.7692 / B2) TaxID=1082931 RepID=G4R9H1_PELHB|nr:tripartite tricarboxylate transporter TctB family protein [Pelagibacterium halotolerans]AEQ50391.1 tricarboxylate transport protein TctB [Pelagibacterium halotolerans B2]QJR19633.1 tripartite tricarboxylate transporter TctB family protein [Pelagibacterium halotolerans]SDZ86087.1 Tripartite tricarboxylate transporter TctB family protein [Pelagibacterium halotolerans]